MITNDIKYDFSEGAKHLDQATVDEAVEAGFSSEYINSVLVEAGKSSDTKSVRSLIYNKVADPESILGTVADASQMLVLGQLVDLIALDSASSFEDYKTIKMQQLAGLSGGDASNLVASAKDFLNKIETGDIKMPFLAKEGQATGVFADVAVRATGVADILIAAQEASE